ncbi:MAG: ABC transporter permease, partial [Deltaproteobacteria bacterium]
MSIQSRSAPPGGARRLLGYALRGLLWPTRAVVVQRRSRVLMLLTLTSGIAVAAVYQHQTLGELPFAVVDDDGTGITRTLTLSLDATRELSVVRGMPDFATASAAVERGEVAGALWLPDGFTGAIKRGEAGPAVLLVDGRNILVSKTAQRAAETVLATVGVGIEMTIARKTGLGPEEALGRAAPIALALDRPWNPRGSYAVYLAPALLLFNVHLFCLLFAAFLLAPPTPERTGSRLHPPVDHPVARAAALVGAVVPAAGVLALFVGVVLPWLGMPVVAAPGPLVGFGLAFIGVSLLEAATLRAVIPSPALATQV